MYVNQNKTEKTINPLLSIYFHLVFVVIVSMQCNLIVPSA